MKLREKPLGVLLSEEGRQGLQLAALNLEESQFVWVYVDETDDLGLCVRVHRDDGDHLVLIRWEYILSIDVPAKVLEMR